MDRKCIVGGKKKKLYSRNVRIEEMIPGVNPHHVVQIKTGIKKINATVVGFNQLRKGKSIATTTPVSKIASRYMAKFLKILSPRIPLYKLK